MNYRSVADLNEGILRWIPSLPRDLELIVGIPRSGMLAANLLALHLNLPLVDLEGFAAGRLFKAGERCQYTNGDDFYRCRRNVLVVDDSVLQGNQMARVRRSLRSLERVHRVRYAAVYVQPGMEELVDYHCELLPRPRVFEWHLMHHGNLRHWCVDIDGVLCPDPTAADNDDGKRYRSFLRNVEPTVIPTKEIGWLVTCRLEKYRAETEGWLRRHGIHFRHLVMMDYPDMAARRLAKNYARFKAEVYRRSGATLFIESSPSQASQIVALSGKSVFCFETREMIRPGVLAKVKHQPQEILTVLWQNPMRDIRKMLLHFLKT